MPESLSLQLVNGGSPVVLVARNDGTLRFRVNFRLLNAQTIPDIYTLPRMDDCLDNLGNANIFTTLDANRGYWKIPITTEDSAKTTFITQVGTYRYIRMPFSLQNAPVRFQRTLDIILSGVRWQTCLVYLNNVIIFSRDEMDHVQHVDALFQLLKQAGFTLKVNKCSWFQPRVNYLEHVVMPGKLAISAGGTKTIAGAEFPRDTTQPKSFLSACNVYWKFVSGFSCLTRPLNAMLKKGH